MAKDAYFAGLYFDHVKHNGELGEEDVWVTSHEAMLREQTRALITEDLFLPFVQAQDTSGLRYELLQEPSILVVAGESMFRFSELEMQEVGAEVFQHLRAGAVTGIEVVEGGREGLMENQHALLIQKKGDPSSPRIRGVLEASQRRDTEGRERLVRFQLLLPGGNVLKVSR